MCEHYNSRDIVFNFYGQKSIINVNFIIGPSIYNNHYAHMVRYIKHWLSKGWRANTFHEDNSVVDALARKDYDFPFGIHWSDVVPTFCCLYYVKLSKLWNLDNFDRCYFNGEERVRQRVIKTWTNCQEVKIVIEIIYLDENDIVD